MAGLNFVSVKENDSSETEIGLNLGTGGEYALDFGSIFSELKWAGVGSDADQYVISAGVRIAL